MAKLIVAPISFNVLVFLLGILARFIIQGFRDKTFETDYVIPHELSLFGLVASCVILAAFYKAPELVCPAAASGKFFFEGPMLLLIFLLMQFCLFAASIAIAGVIEKKSIRATIEICRAKRYLEEYYTEIYPVSSLLV